MFVYALYLTIPINKSNSCAPKLSETYIYRPNQKKNKTKKKKKAQNKQTFIQSSPSAKRI